MSFSKLNSKGICMLLLFIMTISQMYGMNRLDPECDPCKLEVALNSLSEHYAVLFSYKTDLVKDVEVSFEINEEEAFDEALDRLLNGLHLKYKSIDSKYYLLFPKGAGNDRNIRRMERKIKSLRSLERETGIRLFRKLDNNSLALKKIYTTVQSKFIDFVIQGRVVGSDNQPLVGVNILIKGTNTGTTTDSDGHFVLDGVENGDILIVSYIGYESQEVTVDGPGNITITMLEDVQTLDEVVVVGYGTQKKVNLTGSVGVATSERLESRSIANVGEGLQGVIPNLNITVRNGDPSNSPEFNVRGFTSINGGEPLILVDNIPMDINRINPNDIESISVLKDASAGAIYGARAAFGVILIKTKSAEKDGINISLNSQFSLAKPILKMNPIDDPYLYTQLMNKASIRTTGTPLYDEEFVQNTKIYSENPIMENAWKVSESGVLNFYGSNDYKERLVTDFAPANQQNVSISGGSERVDYYVSGGYLEKNGYLRDNNMKFQRYNLLTKVDFKVNDWLKLNQHIVFNSQHNDRPTEYGWDVYINSLARVGTVMPIQFPDLPYYITSGDREEYEPYIGKYFGGTNFFPYLMEGGRNTYTNNDLWLTAGATLTPIDGLEIVSSFSYQFFNRDFKNVRSKVEIVNRDLLSEDRISFELSTPDYIDVRNAFNRAYVFNLYGTYDFQNLDRHHLSATLGFNQEWNHYQNMEGTNFNLITPSITSIHATTGAQELDGGEAHVSLRGAFYRINYNFDERYLFEFNGRYDGTSRFQKSDRFGFFPSFSAGWRISEEDFMIGTRQWLDNLKVRASYGTLGNQLLGTNYYPYIATMNSGITRNYPLILEGSTPLLNIMWPNLISPSLTWERVVSKNIGLDIMLLQSRLDFSFDMYTRDTKDMLRSRDYPDILGATPPSENAADLRTQGWELSLTWRDRFESDFSYDITIGLSDWTSEITKYENHNGNIGDYYVGKQIGEIWGLTTVGIFQSQGDIDNAPDQSNIGNNWKPGDIQYADLNGDREISKGIFTLDDPGDLSIIGNSNPRYQYGINLNVNYKNWGFNTFFQGVVQRDIWPSTNDWTWFYPFKTLYLESNVVDLSWSEDNRDAYFPAPSLAYDNRESKNFEQQTRYLQPGGYVRLKNLMISYALPIHILQKLHVNRLEVYLTGMNLWEFSKIRRPLDPESIPEITAGTPGGIEYPMQRQFTAGIKVHF